MKKKTQQSLMFGAVGALLGYYIFPVALKAVGYGALALKPNAGHMGALAYKKNLRRNAGHMGALAMKKNGYGGVHKMGMHPVGAIHAPRRMNAGHMGALRMNAGHMGALRMNAGHMGAIHTNPHSLLGEFSARNALHHM